jgi:hypothetical protein
MIGEKIVSIISENVKPATNSAENTKTTQSSLFKKYLISGINRFMNNSFFEIFRAVAIVASSTTLNFYSGSDTVLSTDLSKEKINNEKGGELE